MSLPRTNKQLNFCYSKSRWGGGGGVITVKNQEKFPFRFEIHPYSAEASLIHPKHKDAKIFENHLNPVILVFIG